MLHQARQATGYSGVTERHVSRGASMRWSSVVAGRRRTSPCVWAAPWRRQRPAPRRRGTGVLLRDARISRQWHDVQVSGVVLGVLVLITLVLELHG
jgi:hypothetical protein